MREDRPCPCCAATLTAVADLKALLLDRLPPARPDPAVALRVALADECARSKSGWIVVGDVVRAARAEAAKAASHGDPDPDLIIAMRRAGIGNAYALGRWISARPEGEAERGGEERGGVQWKVRGFEAVDAVETAHPLRRRVGRA